MQRLIWAIKCFFLVLFARRLPADAVEACAPPELLAKSARAQLPPTQAKPSEQPPEKPMVTPPPVERVVEKIVEKIVIERGPDRRAEGAVQALAVLQREGRLLDFLLEDIESYADDQIGGAVRAIHKGCRKALADHFPLVPIIDAREEETVKVPVGFDPATIRLIGNVSGVPPFSGVLRHHGWRAVKVDLPNRGEGDGATIVAPAEVELS